MDPEDDDHDHQQSTESDASQEHGPDGSLTRVEEEEEALTRGGDTAALETLPDAKPDASLGDAFLDKFLSLPHQGNTRAIRDEQERMYQALELANWKLASLNEVSEATFQEHAPLFRQQVKSLHEMKKELDSIFRRIRTLKAKVSVMYPKAYAAAQERVSVHNEDPDNR